MNKIILVLNIVIIAIFLLSVFFVSAVQTKMLISNDANQKNSLDQDKVQKLDKAIYVAVKNNDYESWKSLIESTLTQENFNKIVERLKNSESSNQSKNA